VGGAAAALINNNAVPAMNQILKGKNLNIEKMKNNVSAINTAAFSLGSIIGPILSSLMTEYAGFRLSCLILSGLMLLFGLIKFYSAFFYKDKEGDLIQYHEVNPLSWED
jgi:MFS family permease